MWYWRIWLSGGLSSAGLMVSLDGLKGPLQHKLRDSMTLKGSGHSRSGKDYTKKDLGYFSCAGDPIRHRIWLLYRCFHAHDAECTHFQEYTYVYLKELVLFCSGSIANHCPDSAFQALKIFEFQAVFF